MLIDLIYFNFYITVITLNLLGLFFSSRGAKDITTLHKKLRAYTGNKETGHVKENTLIWKQQERLSVFVCGVCPPQSCALLLQQCWLHSRSQGCAEAEEWGIGADARGEIILPLQQWQEQNHCLGSAFSVRFAFAVLETEVECCFDPGCCVKPVLSAGRHRPGCGKHPTSQLWYPCCCMGSLSHSHCYIRSSSSLGERWKIVL